MIAVDALRGTDRASAARLERLLLQQPLPRDALFSVHRSIEFTARRRSSAALGHAVRARSSAPFMLTGAGRDLHRPHRAAQVFHVSTASSRSSTASRSLVIVMYRRRRRLALARRALRLLGEAAMSGALSLLELNGIGKSFRGVRAVHDRLVRRAGRRHRRADRPQRRGQDHDLQHDRRRLSARRRQRSRLDGQQHLGPARRSDLPTPASAAPSRS